MPKLIIVVGLPGSGKSRYARAFAGGRLRVFEDFLGHPGTPWSPHGICPLLRCLKDGQDCIGDQSSVTQDPHRASTVEFRSVLVLRATLDWHYFQSDPESCIRNVEMDGRPNTKDRLGHIAKYTPT
jgi:hypothetical protein